MISAMLDAVEERLLKAVKVFEISCEMEDPAEIID